MKKVNQEELTITQIVNCQRKNSHYQNIMKQTFLKAEPTKERIDSIFINKEKSEDVYIVKYKQLEHVTDIFQYK
jgi:hypothetical protein